MEIKIYATLRQAVGRSSIVIDDRSDFTVGQMLQEVYDNYPPLRAEMFDDDNGALNPSIHVFINGRDMRYINGLETPVSLDDDVRLFPPVGGGL